MPTKRQGLLERLADPDNGIIICAEGYLFQFEKRGYLQGPPYVPEVVLEHPDLVKALHHEFVHAGSDVVEAFTYYAHRQKLKVIDKVEKVEVMNRTALHLANEVAMETQTLFAGNICNTNAYYVQYPSSWESVTAMFKEQVEWAVDAGVDYMIAETFSDFGEAKLALEAIQKYGEGRPAVVTISPNSDGSEVTDDGVPLTEALRRLEDLGAAVVGLNCVRGPDTIIPLMKEIRKACKGPLACLPAPLRTGTDDGQGQTTVTWFDFKHKGTDIMAMPDLEPFYCSRSDIAEFTRQCVEIGIQYMGLCCGNGAHYVRTMAETLGRRPAASRYAPDMSKHYRLGNDGTQKHEILKKLRKTEQS